METAMSISELVKKFGVENVLVRMPMRPIHRAIFLVYTRSSDPETSTSCVISEDRYKVSGNYKISLKSLDSRFGKEDLYQSDFNKLWKDGIIEVFIKADKE